MNYLTDRNDELEETVLNQIRENMKYWRKQKGYTQEKLAHLISENTTKQYISSLERGKKAISIPMLITISKALDVDLVQFLNPSLPNERAVQLRYAIHMLRNAVPIEQVKEASPLLLIEELKVLAESNNNSNSRPPLKPS